MPPLNPPSVLPPTVIISCGQNVTLPLSGINLLLLQCAIFNGSQPTMEVFKNGVSISSTSSTLISPFGDEDFGNYTFLASTRRCGSTSAVSWVLPS